MQLNTEIEAIEADRLAQQPAVQVLEAESKELNQEIQVLNKQHGVLNTDIRALKQAGQAVAEEVWPRSLHQRMIRQSLFLLA